MREYELNKLQADLEAIVDRGWIESQRHGNDGGVGNTLEDLLGIAENNFSLPDFGNWEIKSQRARTNSLLTLFHLEPGPRRNCVVPHILLPLYGWPHQQAGSKYPPTEMSFRQTLQATQYTDRGFKIFINRTLNQIEITFQYSFISSDHDEWKTSVSERVGVGDLDPSPFWSFGQIQNILDEKLKNIIYVVADSQKENNKEFFKYKRFEVFTEPSLTKFLDLLEAGNIFIDFDARTGHNHGTKFRIKRNHLPHLYHNHVTA